MKGGDEFKEVKAQCVECHEWAGPEGRDEAEVGGLLRNHTDGDDGDGEGDPDQRREDGVAQAALEQEEVDHSDDQRHHDGRGFGEHGEDECAGGEGVPKEFALLGEEDVAEDGQ